MNAKTLSNMIGHKALLVLASLMLAFAPMLACGSAYADTSKYVPMKGDTAGTVFTFNDNISRSLIAGDLYWLSGSPVMEESMLEHDIIVAGNTISITDTVVKGDVRAAGPSFQTANLEVDGLMSVAGYDVIIGEGTSAKGIYSYAADRIVFNGSVKGAFLYAQTLVINGTIRGDATVSAQNITIGPDANITGTLHIHSGQKVEVPPTATVGHIDITKEGLNTIDMLDELRSTIAPFFQIGGAVFTLISFALMAAILVWAVSNKVRESNRIVRSHPIPMVVLGIALFIGLPLLAALCFALIFTIPLALVLVLLVMLSVLVSIPFTGASLGMLLPGKMTDKVKAIIGTVIIVILLQFPYLNIAVSIICCIYFLGYIGYTMNRGHDEAHNAQQGVGSSPAENVESAGVI